VVGDVQTVVIAAFGGLLLNVVPLWEDTKKPKSDRAPKDLLYWMFYIIWPLVGGALAYLYIIDGSKLRPFLALSVGLGAPTTLRSLMSAAGQPSQPPKRAEQ
jgi:peptidoglycan/LPS O-acetylase OafA/YrhL